ncbi:MAG: hypothetical protein RJA22_3126 [Verrucomicrobiota bacterium]|jgi:DNA-binding NarL/FixJ family response regulator
MPITVSIVEDDDGFRAGLLRVIGQARDFRCQGVYADAETALEGLPHDKVDVVLMDINLPGLSGVECVRRLKARGLASKIVMLTVYDNPDHIFEALAAGATGYLLKETPPAEVQAAIRDVHAGGAPMSSQIARKVVDFFHRGPVTESDSTLSPREQEILHKLAQGFLVKEVAEQLGIGFDTARTHIRRIYEKLHVHSRAQAVAKYFPSGLRPPREPRSK